MPRAASCFSITVFPFAVRNAVSHSSRSGLSSGRATTAAGTLGGRHPESGILPVAEVGRQEEDSAARAPGRARALGVRELDARESLGRRAGPPRGGARSRGPRSARRRRGRASSTSAGDFSGERARDVRARELAAAAGRRGGRASPRRRPAASARSGVIRARTPRSTLTASASARFRKAERSRLISGRPAREARERLGDEAGLDDGHVHGDAVDGERETPFELHGVLLGRDDGGRARLLGGALDAAQRGGAVGVVVPERARRRRDDLQRRERREKRLGPGEARDGDARRARAGPGLRPRGPAESRMPRTRVAAW